MLLGRSLNVHAACSQVEATDVSRRTLSRQACSRRLIAMSARSFAALTPVWLVPNRCCCFRLAGFQEESRRPPASTGRAASGRAAAGLAGLDGAVSTDASTAATGLAACTRTSPLSPQSPPG